MDLGYESTIIKNIIKNHKFVCGYKGRGPFVIFLLICIMYDIHTLLCQFILSPEVFMTSKFIVQFNTGYSKGIACLHIFGIFVAMYAAIASNPWLMFISTSYAIQIVYIISSCFEFIYKLFYIFWRQEKVERDSFNVLSVYILLGLILMNIIYNIWMCFQFRSIRRETLSKLLGVSGRTLLQFAI